MYCVLKNDSNLIINVTLTVLSFIILYSRTPRLRNDLDLFWQPWRNGPRHSPVFIYNLWLYEVFQPHYCDLVMFVSSGWLWVHDIYIKEKSENGALVCTEPMCLFIYEHHHFTAHSSTCGVVVIPRCFFSILISKYIRSWVKYMYSVWKIIAWS